jgi:hypothetical protein
MGLLSQEDLLYNGIMNDSKSGCGGGEPMTEGRRAEQKDRLPDLFVYRMNRDPYLKSEERRKRAMYFAEHGYGRRCTEFVPEFKVGG